MKAYEVKRGTKVRVIDEDVKTPPASLQIKKGDEITLHRADGMYCNGTDKDGDIVYIAGWTQVELCED